MREAFNVCRLKLVAATLFVTPLAVCTGDFRRSRSARRALGEKCSEVLRTATGCERVHIRMFSVFASKTLPRESIARRGSRTSHHFRLATSPASLAFR